MKTMLRGLEPGSAKSLGDAPGNAQAQGLSVSQLGSDIMRTQW